MGRVDNSGDPTLPPEPMVLGIVFSPVVKMVLSPSAEYSKVTNCNLFLFNTPPKFNSSPLKSYRNPIGKDRLPFPPFFMGCKHFRGDQIHDRLGSTGNCQIQTKQNATPRK